MNRMVLGALAALLMVAAGMFWWQGRAELARGVPPPEIAGNGPGAEASPGEAPIVLPSANPHGAASALPRIAKARMSPEEKRFNRYDRNRDGQITRAEMLSTRVKAFQKLDTNHDNMLSFEEWAVKTSDRFKEIDTNHDGVISPAELAAYDAAVQAKRKHRKASCNPVAGGGRGDARAAEDGSGSEGDAGDPAN